MSGLLGGSFDSPGLAAPGGSFGLGFEPFPENADRGNAEREQLLRGLDPASADLVAAQDPLDRSQGVTASGRPGAPPAQGRYAALQPEAMLATGPKRGVASMLALGKDSPPGEADALEAVTWKDERTFMRAICMSGKSGVPSVDFRLKQPSGKRMTVQFDTARFTHRAVAQQVERLRAAVPGLPVLDEWRLRHAFGEALGLRHCADRCDLVAAMPTFFDENAEPDNAPAFMLGAEVAQMRQELESERRAGGDMLAHEQMATTLPSLLLRVLEHWASIETRRQQLSKDIARLGLYDPGARFPAPKVPLEKGVTEDLGPSRTLQALESALQQQIHPSSSPMRKHPDSCWREDGCEGRQCMTAKQCHVQ